MIKNARICELSELVDDIALPLDSANREVQGRLRGKGFLPVFDRLPETSQAITENEIKIGFHTAFTMDNCYDIQGIYDYIQRTEFDYWRIYEFNHYLAFMSAGERKPLREITTADCYEFNRRLQRIRELRGLNMQESEDELSPLFRRAFSDMQRYKDERIQFDSITGVEEPYIFIDNRGESVSKK
ncbi:hypothetical protein GF386_06250 [Candidatus Pacearchaeota archaeon]|nr:hypothetical protein [Candidatus Pacearchaeota archaeon]MBD3283690.1 hypothetical protein [Candidatus Pacearchaeota archaeon]